MSVEIRSDEIAQWRSGEVTLYQGDCFYVMTKIREHINHVITDMPYGVTRNEWDSPLSADFFWSQINSVCDRKASKVLFAQNPFASDLISANRKEFRHDIVWRKNRKTGFLNAKKMPLRQHEMILVFCGSPPVYNPQKTTGHKPVNGFTKRTSDGSNYGKTETGISGGGQTDRYPTSVADYKCVSNCGHGRFHSTQKPLELMEYLVKTYTNPGDVVLDPFMGSGTTGLACVIHGRGFVGIEQSKKHYQTALERISERIAI